MSCSVHWKPASTTGKRIGGHQLREALEREHGGWPIRMDHNDIGFLRGLAAAEIDGANDLLEALARYPVIILELEC